MQHSVFNGCVCFDFRHDVLPFLSDEICLQDILVISSPGEKPIFEAFRSRLLMARVLFYVFSRLVVGRITGNNHIIANIESISILGCIAYRVLEITDSIKIHNLTTQILHWMFTDYEKCPYEVGRILVLLSMFGFFLLGTLLADCDSRKSLLGRYIYIPVEHRTWLHSIWPVLILGSISYCFCPIMMWLTLGYFLHLFFDNLSAMGIAWLYPFQTYRKYPSGAKIADGHKLKLYHTGRASETAVIIVLTAITLLVVYLTFFVN